MHPFLVVITAFTATATAIDITYPPRGSETPFPRDSTMTIQWRDANLGCPESNGLVYLQLAHRKADPDWIGVITSTGTPATDLSYTVPFSVVENLTRGNGVTDNKYNFRLTARPDEKNEPCSESGDVIIAG